ncbi:MAG TPA: hypothetical protein VEB19_08140 [Gemmatimonadaceae bacterium]|nr:hypothetical protein [Gemmatimonadaceae bacterium]
MTTKSLIEPDLTHSVIGAFYEVYNTLGYGSWNTSMSGQWSASFVPGATK